MVKTQDRSDSPHCARCGSDVVTTHGAGRVVAFEGATVRVPAAMPLMRCHGCGMVYPTPEQAAELRAAATGG